jgi:hypothetical protein
LLKETPAQVAAAAARVDELVLAGLSKAGQAPNAPANDEQLVRRLYLDIVGRIPTVKEASEFLGDKGADKRARLVDRLLANEGYNSQMFNYLADMMRVMDDYGKGVKTYLYQEWLKEQVATNRPWNELVHELLTAEGKLTNEGAVGYLLRDKAMPLDSLANTLTIFLGANVACAQCHNHPLADWTQKDFYQMAAYFGATSNDYPKAQKFMKRLTDKRKTPAQENRQLMVRVLAPNLAAVKTLPRNQTTYPKDYTYDDAKPGEAVEPKLIEWSSEDPKGTDYGSKPQKPEELRKTFADWMTHPENPRFAASMANRLWKRIFGMAIQEPITDLDDLSKAANPELLAHLAAEMKRVGFDLREFQRILFNSTAYQRQASVTPDLGDGPYLFPGPLLRRMTAEQTWDSVLTLVVGPEVDGYKLLRADGLKRLNITGPQITAQAVMEKVHELERTGEGGGARTNAKRKANSRYMNDYDGTPPPRFEGMLLARASELQQPEREAHFLRMFGQSDRQMADGNSVEGGVPQVLMMMNGDVQKVIANSNSSVLRSAAQEPTPEGQVESLYFSFLSRRPALEERATAVEGLKNGLKLADLTWVLFNTREFIFVQ